MLRAKELNSFRAKRSQYSQSHNMVRTTSIYCLLVATPGPGTYRAPSDFGYYLSREFLEK